MRSDITPGSTFPDYALPDHTDTVRKLSELQGDDPLILTLARGHYCPKEHQQHRAQEAQSEIASKCSSNDRHRSRHVVANRFVMRSVSAVIQFVRNAGGSMIRPVRITK